MTYLVQHGRSVPLCRECGWHAATDGPYCEADSIAAPTCTVVEQRAGSPVVPRD